MGSIYSLHFFLNTKAKDEKRPKRGEENSVPHFSQIKKIRTLFPTYFTIKKTYWYKCCNFSEVRHFFS